MHTWLTDHLQAAWRRIRPPKAHVRRMTADEETRLSWARAVPTLEAVPEAYRGFFDSLLQDGREFPLTVLTPTYRGFFHRATEKLVCASGRDLHILEQGRAGLETLCFPFGDITCVELRSVLLDAHIKLTGQTRDGVAEVSLLKFNAVTEHLFMPILERIRRTAEESGAGVEGMDSGVFDTWGAKHFKFMNYARRSLLEGEKLIHAILQPEIRVSVIKLLGLAYQRTLSPAHVSLLTDQELILIRDEERQMGTGKYGGIWEFIPLSKIAGLKLEARERDLVTLFIRLVDGTIFESLFQPEKRAEVEKLVARFENLRGG
jgi:hypothetical protein